MVIYLDELMALNFLIDYLLLSAVSALGSIYSGRLKRALAALLGSVYSACVVLYPGKLISCFISAAACAAAMTVIAFGITSIWNGLRRIFLFMFCGAVFAGFIVLLSRFGQGTVNIFGSVVYASAPGIVTAALCLFVYILINAFLRYRVSSDERKLQLAGVRLCCEGKETVFNALVDTGNRLRDPVSGAYVLICRASALAPVLPPRISVVLGNGKSAENLFRELVRTDTAKGFRLIPYHTIGEKHGLIPVFRPDELWLDGKQRNDIIVGVSTVESDEDEPFSAVIGI